MDLQSLKLHSLEVESMSFLTQKSRRILKGLFFLSRWIHCHPYSWNDVDSVPQKHTSGWLGTARWYFNVTLVLSYQVFLLYQLLQLTSSPDAGMLSKAYMSIMNIYFCTVSIFQVMAVLSRNRFEGFIVRYLRFLGTCGGIYLISF